MGVFWPIWPISYVWTFQRYWAEKFKLEVTDNDWYNRSCFRLWLLCFISGTLCKYLDNCITSSGKRFLRRWLCHPLKDLEQINQRLNVVEELMGRVEIMALIAQYLRKVPDLERFLGQIKATFQSSALLLLPLIGNKILKQRVSSLFIKHYQCITLFVPFSH